MTALSKEGCIPTQTVAVPCLPAEEGVATGSCMCLLAELVQVVWCVAPSAFMSLLLQGIQQ